MKIVFVGPSLPDVDDYVDIDILVRPPAIQGDIMRAIEEGATSIGLIDGQFEFVAPVWHKEILFALSKGVAITGAASMGALRAAECAEFGMHAIGRIAQDYVSGKRYDDADVALLYGPAELGYPPITLPLVNVDATLERARELGLISHKQQTALASSARSIFFKERTWKQIAKSAGQDLMGLDVIVEKAWIDQKRADSLALLKVMGQKAEAISSPVSWTFNKTPIWRSMYS